MAVVHPRPTFGRIAATFVCGAILATSCTSGDGQTSGSSSTTPELFPSETLPDIDDTPAAPVGLTVVDTSDGAIELQWDPSRSADVTGYVVTRVGTAGTTQRFDVAGTSFVDSGLDDGTIFTYTVAAVGVGGTGERSESVSAQVGVDANPPSVPGRPRVVDSDAATVVLEWRESKDISGISGYVVTRTIDGVATETVVPDPRFADDIDPGLVVTYSVRAVDGFDNESADGRSVTFLSGTTDDRIVIVVSKQPEPDADPETARLRDLLLDEGYTVSWFEDQVFDSNITSTEDLVVLVGDVEGEGFDWNIFSTDSTIIGLKSMFVEAGGITENPPKLDRLAQLDYLPPGTEGREVVLTTTGRPRPVVYIPEAEQLPSLEVWGRPVWSDTIAVVGLIPAGGELADEDPAPGCRAFFPGNPDALAEQTDAGWELLIEFIGDVDERC